MKLQSEWSDPAGIRTLQDYMPVLVTWKADEDWIHSNWEKVETSFSPLSMGEKNPHSRANNTKVNNPIRPNFKLIRVFMPVVVTCKSDKDLIKGDWEKLETSFFFTTQGQVTPKWLVRYGWNLNASKDFMPVPVTYKFDDNQIHSNWEKMETPFFPFKFNGNAQGRITL